MQEKYKLGIYSTTTRDSPHQHHYRSSWHMTPTNPDTRASIKHTSSGRVIADQGSEFTSINTRMFSQSLRVKLEFILAEEHKQDLVE